MVSEVFDTTGIERAENLVRGHYGTGIHIDAPRRVFRLERTSLLPAQLPSRTLRT